MSQEHDPPRFLTAGSDASPRLREVMQAGRAHEPSAADLARLHAKLAAAVDPSGAAAVKARAIVPTAMAAKGLWLKGILSALAALAVAVTGANLVPRITTSPTLPSSPALAPSTQAPIPSAPRLGATEVPSEVHEPAAATMAPKASASPLKTEPIAPAGEEAPLLARAHRALLDGDAPGALRLAEEHRVKFPRGSLEQEREVIAVQALVAAGDLPRAKERVAKFRSKYPGSSHLSRILTLVGAE